MTFGSVPDVRVETIEGVRLMAKAKSFVLNADAHLAAPDAKPDWLNSP